MEWIADRMIKIMLGQEFTAELPVSMGFDRRLAHFLLTNLTDEHLNIMSFQKRFGQFLMISPILIGLISTSVHAQQGGGGGGMGMRGSSTAQPALLQIEAVQKELGLSGDQIKDAKKLGDQYQAEIQKRMAKMGFDPMAMQDLPAEERFAKFREMAQAGTRVAQETERGFRTKLDLLLEPGQNKRLGEIQLQAIGIAALRVQDVSMKLGLTKVQRDQLEKMDAESRQAMTARFQQGGGGGAAAASGGGAPSEDFAKSMREAREAQETKMLAVLTDKQKQDFVSMKGKPFDISVLRPMGGGGFGRPPATKN